MNHDAWSAQGKMHTVHGRRYFVVDTDPDASKDRPTLVMLHGYPTSSRDFHCVLPDLAARFRVVVHDHLGFGLSDKPRDFSYACLEQTDCAIMLWRHLNIESAHVVAHDYGTSIATELLARHSCGFRPIRIESITLSNGSVHIEMARLRFIQKLLRNPTVGPVVAKLTSQRVFNRNMRKLWHDPTLLSDAELDTMWELLIRDDGRTALPKITRYLDDRVRYWHRWVGALQQSDLPLHFLWGADDPITGRAVANVHHAEAPGSRLTLLDEVGHYPMLESPQRWTDALLSHLRELPSGWAGGGPLRARAHVA